MRRKPRAFFSFRSPYSWLALNQLERSAPGVLQELELIPFWDPDAEMADALLERGGVLHYVQMSKAKHMYLLQDTKRLSAALGLEVVWPIDVACRWEVPHLAWLRARRAGHEHAFYSAVVAARWQRGENICDPEVIGRLAASVGLEPETLAGASLDADTRAEALDCLVCASEDDIFGIPYFRVGTRRFWGFDRVSEFLLALEELGIASGVAYLDWVAEDVAPEVDVRVDLVRLLKTLRRERDDDYDEDTAGGCG